MKIHPLFEEFLYELASGDGELSPTARKEWEKAGKPVLDGSEVTFCHLDHTDLAAKDARIRQLEEEREAWKRNVIPTSNSEAWKSGLISCASEMPCQKRIKELERQLERLEAKLSEAVRHSHVFGTQATSVCAPCHNAAIEEAAKVSEDELTVGGFIEQRRADVAARIRGLKKP